MKSCWPACGMWAVVLLLACFFMGRVPVARAAESHAGIEVAFAGMAYAGAEGSLDQRFPYSRRFEREQTASGASPANQMLADLAAQVPQNIRIVPQIEALRGRDQAPTVALVIGSEIVSVEQFGDLKKLTVLIRGQAMFFDFKSMNVLRTYPISFAYVDVLDHEPGADEIQARVRLVYQGAGGKPGLLSRFARTVAQAELPAQVPRYVRIAAAELKPEALAVLPAYLRGDEGTAQTWLADLVSEDISTRAAIPIIPFAKGYAIGNVMSMRISDGTVFELRLPRPDYEIKVELSGFRKVKYSEMQGGATSFVYGAYAKISIEEPLSGKLYLNTALKNGETRVIPASQRDVDDFPNYYDAVNGLFVKLALLMGGRGDPGWLKSSSSAPDIDRQMTMTRELIAQCR